MTDQYTNSGTRAHLNKVTGELPGDGFEYGSAIRRKEAKREVDEQQQTDQLFYVGRFMVALVWFCLNGRFHFVKAQVVIILKIPVQTILLLRRN
ncbi:MAG: hypothetical protein DIZ78_04780 [endosymbiont of Escarpia spicata]|uniref:Uncharacterized protein n=1 Tax=endosymbiont of Escarpia spicata TaxID=2200908 RepID=A0A370DT14_9GAMM|nr:MAG: hypothetical protein DIZ78_04780 [endosymbiont of Escarpia spicata]